MPEHKIPTRDEIAQEFQWDLSPLFTADNEWKLLHDAITEKIPRYESFKGRLGESLALFREALEFDLEISRELEKLFTYAHLKNDEDKTNNTYQAMYQKAVILYTKISEASSFFTPELQALPDNVLKSYRDSDQLAPYSFHLEKILRYKPHTLSPEIEMILAMGSETTDAAAEIFSQLDNADLQFGTLENEKGETHELSHGNFNSFLSSPDRAVRQKAFFQYYESYDTHKHTISTTLAYANKKDWFQARVRNFSSCRQAALFSDNVPETVYDNLLATVKENMPPLVRYLAFRKEVLELDELHIYDTYVPLIKNIPFHMPYEEAVETCVKSAAILGDAYAQQLRDGLSGGWVDRYENKGKRSGAYSSGCYDSPPYILMNYKEDNINSLYTLMHEAGHSMHSFYSKNAQPYVYNNYTIFVAEVASTFNETLLSNYLLDYYKDDPRMQAYILTREIDNIRATLYRQTMFAEFEKITHTRTEQGEPLTLELLRSDYRSLLETYFDGALHIDDVLELECLRIPHFYSAFYVYKYATGISAALALAEKVMSEGEKATEAYLKFLTLGGSMFPIDELKIAGVDMTEKQPVQNALTHFGKLVEKLSDVYKKM